MEFLISNKVLTPLPSGCRGIASNKADRGGTCLLTFLCKNVRTHWQYRKVNYITMTEHNHTMNRDLMAGKLKRPAALIMTFLQKACMWSEM